MSGITAYTIALKARDYPTKYNGLLAFLDPYVDEVVAARDGQPSVLAAINLRIKASQGLTQALAANGYRITGLPAPVAADEPATKAFAEGLAFAPALPGQAGNAGKEVVTDGTTAAWGVSIPGSIAILNSLGFYG